MVSNYQCFKKTTRKYLIENGKLLLIKQIYTVDAEKLLHFLQFPDTQGAVLVWYDCGLHCVNMSTKCVELK